MLIILFLPLWFSISRQKTCPSDHINTFEIPLISCFVSSFVVISRYWLWLLYTVWYCEKLCFELNLFLLLTILSWTSSHFFYWFNGITNRVSGLNPYCPWCVCWYVDRIWHHIMIFFRFHNSCRVPSWVVNVLSVVFNYVTKFWSIPFYGWHRLKQKQQRR